MIRATVFDLDETLVDSAALDLDVLELATHQAADAHIAAKTIPLLIHR
jgi:phosphoglycolate phosphatase-like HAD superfamily hydrolase